LAIFAMCGHNKQREPAETEVTELIDGVDEVAKTLFYDWPER
jgi:hypothetical protein